MTTKTLVSLIAAAVVLVLSLLLAGDLALFINPAGLVLVFGGTLVGVFLAFPLDTIRGLLEQVRWLGRHRVMELEELVETFQGLARLQRAEGALALEEPARESGNPFLELGVALVVDRVPRNEIRQRLEQELEFFLNRRASQQAVLNLMGRLAPAFGLAGTMIGLVRMLHMVKDPASVAEGMSVALLTTLYGIMLANLVILPLERKLAEITRAQAVEASLITEGVVGLALGLNGAAIAARLRSFRLAGGDPQPGLAASPKAEPELSPSADGPRLFPLFRSSEPLKVWSALRRRPGHEH